MDFNVLPTAWEYPRTKTQRRDTAADNKRQTDRNRDGKSDRQTETETGNQTDRQTDRQGEFEISTANQVSERLLGPKNKHLFPERRAGGLVA